MDKIVNVFIFRSMIFILTIRFGVTCIQMEEDLCWLEWKTIPYFGRCHPTRNQLIQRDLLIGLAPLVTLKFWIFPFKFQRMVVLMEHKYIGKRKIYQIRWTCNSQNFNFIFKLIYLVIYDIFVISFLLLILA